MHERPAHTPRRPTEESRLTANAMLGDEAVSRAEGMDDYLSKPLQLDRLAAVLERWIAQQQAAA